MLIKWFCMTFLSFNFIILPSPNAGLLRHQWLFITVCHCNLSLAMTCDCKWYAHPFFDVVFPSLVLSSSSSNSQHGALEHGLGKAGWLADMAKPPHLALSDSGQESFIRSSYCLNPVILWMFMNDNACLLNVHCECSQLIFSYW